MKYHVLVLGASYGSLFGTKLLMAGHQVSLICTKPTAELMKPPSRTQRLMRSRKKRIRKPFWDGVPARDEPTLVGS